MLKYMSPVWIMSNPRVGSSYLCSLLNSVEMCPRFDEYCQPSMWDDRYLTSPPLHNKIHFGVFKRHFLGKVDLEKLLPGIRYVLLRRKDFVATTVSHYLARELKQFAVLSTGWLNTSNVGYNEEALLELYLTTKRWDAAYDKYFSEREHLEFEYEELVADPIGVTQQVLELCGCQGVPNLDNVIAKMHHPQKEEFIQKLRETVE